MYAVWTGCSGGRVTANSGDYCDSLQSRLDGFYVGALGQYIYANARFDWDGDTILNQDSRNWGLVLSLATVGSGLTTKSKNGLKAVPRGRFSFVRRVRSGSLAAGFTPSHKRLVWMAPAVQGFF
jgi:hypothetical protein